MITTQLLHLNIYFDAGKKFEIEMNAGRYLAGDWGFTTRVVENLQLDGK